MNGNEKRARLARRIKGAVPVALAGLLVTAGVAVAVGVGLQNPSFENDLDNWTESTFDDTGSTRQLVYGAGQVPGCDAPDGYNICVVDGDDTFQATDGTGTRNVTVSPIDGDKMLRIAGPFHSAGENQVENTYSVRQQFTVDPANPVLEMNYNLFTYDYSGFDELRVVVKITSETGDTVAERIQGGFSSGTNLKTTGWRGVSMDMTSYAGQEVNLALEVQGTSDDLYGSWGYFDAGDVPPPPVDAGGASASAPPGVDLKKFITESGLVEFQLENSDISSNGGEVPLTLDLPINAGTSTLSNVTLRFRDQVRNLTNIGGNVWRNSPPFLVHPFQDGELTLEYDATEPGEPLQHFIVTVGSIVLIDPQGVVYNVNVFNQAVANGQNAEQARATAAISGATARLQRETPAGSGTFINVLSADPGISPNVNPQTTGADGKFQWDVSAGKYRVVVTKAGFVTSTSPAVDIPPPVLDLHMPMTPVGGGGSTGGGGGSTGGGGAVTPTPLTAPACKKGFKKVKGKCVKAKKKKKKK